jgi:hypothetical protein
MTDVPRPEASRRPGLVRFVRDVGVNVLANLLSVPILYLIGVAVGLLPHNRTAIIGALATLHFPQLCCSTRSACCYNEDRPSRRW